MQMRLPQNTVRASKRVWGLGAVGSRVECARDVTGTCWHQAGSKLVRVLAPRHIAGLLFVWKACIPPSSSPHSRQPCWHSLGRHSLASLISLHGRGLACSLGFSMLSTVGWGKSSLSFVIATLFLLLLLPLLLRLGLLLLRLLPQLYFFLSSAGCHRESLLSTGRR